MLSEKQTETLAGELAEIIARLFTQCQEKDARHVAQYGVSIVESRCLRILYDDKELTVNQLAQKMSITSGRVTRIIDGLAAKNFVIRRVNKLDRRIYYMVLTNQGENLAKQLAEDHIKIHEAILSRIPEQNRRQMIDFLHKLNAAMDDWIKSE
ncbi:MarR family transcriptional regulator [candidate division KSB1 bacterium]|nr:MarR family transcriptional regulator [candidate division KSB1 bacterium]